MCVKPSENQVKLIGTNQFFRVCRVCRARSAQFYSVLLGKLGKTDRYRVDQAQQTWYQVVLVGECEVLNSPATFQAMMDDIFKDKKAEGWIIIYIDDIFVFTKELLDNILLLFLLSHTLFHFMSNSYL